MGVGIGTLDVSLQIVAYTCMLVTLLGGASFLGYLTYSDAQAETVIGSAPKNGTTIFQPAITPYNTDPGNKLNYNLFVVQGKPTAISPTTFSYTMSFAFTPCGDFANFEQGQYGSNFVLNQDVAVTIDTTTVKFKKGAIMSAKEFTLVFGEGLINDYPFDTYYSNPVVMDITYKDEKGKTVKAPLDVMISPNIHNWRVNVFQVEDYSGLATGLYTGDTIFMNLIVKRSITSIVFAMLQVINMWILALLAITLSSLIWLRKRKVEPPVVTFLISMLFAMNRIRNSMPSVPTVGCFVDVISYFWCVILTAIAASMQLYNYTYWNNFPLMENKPPFKWLWKYDWDGERRWFDPRTWFRRKPTSTSSDPMSDPLLVSSSSDSSNTYKNK